jgi:ATP-binding cassette subfamily B protein
MQTYFSADLFRKTFALLFPYVIRYWRAYGGLFACLLVDISLTFGFAWFLGNITDAAVGSDLQRLKWLIPLGAAFILLSFASAYFSDVFETIAVNGIKRDLKARIYKHILLLPADHIDRHPSGDLLAHFTNDIHSIDGVIGSSLLNLIKFPLISIGVFIYLVHISWELSLLCLFAAPIALLAGALFGLLIRRNSRKIHKLAGEANSLLNETFWGSFVIRSFALESLFYKKYVRQNHELYSLELIDAKLRGWFHAGGDAMGTLIFLISLCLGAYYVMDNRMSVGTLLSFVNLTNHLIYPLTGLAGLWAGFQRSISAVERISQVLEVQTESIRLPGVTSHQSFLHSIEFKDITFSYDGKTTVFNHFHLQIPKGKLVAIVGPSGAGKTTLFHLLQGFYRPQSGTILVDNRPAELLLTSELRGFFAAVPQETFLFSGTIRENLMLARSGITNTELVQAATAANIHPFIMELPSGYDTEIGERGLNLSGGQRQRIAIARALLKDAPILLLDEATSALDSETECQIKEALERLMKDRTTLVIAHRLSTVQHADWIIVLDKGRIVQMGRHNDLILKDGLYRRLNHLQLQKGVAIGDHLVDTSVV